MPALVDDLLLLARLDSGRPLEREEVDLTLLLLEAVEDARVVGPDHHWRLDLPEEPVEVVGDEHRLHQVVTNLLGNARSPHAGRDTVTSSPTSVDEGPFKVHDDGPGIRTACADGSSSGSPAATRRAPGLRAPGSASRWYARSPGPTAGPPRWTAGPATRRSRSRCRSEAIEGPAPTGAPGCSSR